MAGYNHDSSHNKEFIKEEAVFLLESTKSLLTELSSFEHDTTMEVLRLIIEETI